MAEYMIWERKKSLLLMGSTQNQDLEPRYVKVRYGVSTHDSNRLRDIFSKEQRGLGPYDTEIRVYCYRNFAADPPEPPEDAPREERVTVWTTGPKMPAKEFLRLYEPTGEVLS